MPKVQLNARVMFRGSRYEVGDTLEVTDETAERWDRNRIASIIPTKVGGRVVDATGSDIARSAEGVGGYPAGFPGARELTEAGVTLDEVRQMTEEDLMEVDGIGRATAAKIIDAR